MNPCKNNSITNRTEYCTLTFISKWKWKWAWMLQHTECWYIYLALCVEARLECLNIIAPPLFGRYHDLYGTIVTLLLSTFYSISHLPIYIFRFMCTLSLPFRFLSLITRWYVFFFNISLMFFMSIAVARYVVGAHSNSVQRWSTHARIEHINVTMNRCK